MSHFFICFLLFWKKASNKKWDIALHEDVFVEATRNRLTFFDAKCPPTQYPFHILYAEHILRTKYLHKKCLLSTRMLFLHSRCMNRCFKFTKVIIIIRCPVWCWIWLEQTSLDMHMVVLVHTATSGCIAVIVSFAIAGDRLRHCPWQRCHFGQAFLPSYGHVPFSGRKLWRFAHKHRLNLHGLRAICRFTRRQFVVASSLWRCRSHDCRRNCIIEHFADAGTHSGRGEGAQSIARLIETGKMTDCCIAGLDSWRRVTAITHIVTLVDVDWLIWWK